MFNKTMIYKCPYCKRRTLFKFWKSLKKHIETEHKASIETVNKSETNAYNDICCHSFAIDGITPSNICNLFKKICPFASRFYHINRNKNNVIIDCRHGKSKQY